MPRVTRLRTFLSRHLKISNAEADRIIGEGRVRVNGQPVPPAAKLEFWEEIALDGKVIRGATQFSYIKFYKPRGIECTLSPELPGNLLTVFKFPKRLFPVGRLDKESEGLLLLTDDGRIYDGIAISEREKEKEYLVTVDKPIDGHFLEQMRSGVEIMGKITRPAKVSAVEGKPAAFRIILTQGLNRQIRRMCHKLGYRVEELVRLRIVNVELGDLQPGEWRELSSAELEELKRK